MKQIKVIIIQKAIQHIFWKRMGCQVTSVYADQVIGKISYSQQILSDLVKRDYCRPSKIQQENQNDLNHIKQSIQSIYGFTQSFCQSFLFTTLYQHNQYLIYNNGKFVIKILKNSLCKLGQDSKQNNIKILPHNQIISCMDVNQNMCAVGLNGGKLIVWDMKFDEIKVQITLPKPSLSFSSLSISKKYIFVTDTSLPNNISYCFDVQTTKLKASAIVNSLQPTLRGIRFLQNHHVTICAQGLWFFKYQIHEKSLQITKGMFSQFPKTSQCSITNMDDKYIISGGVDGYLYIWSSNYQCIKVIKCFQQQQQLTSVAYNKFCKTVIVGSSQARVKCFSFDIKQKLKDNQKTQKYLDVQFTLSQAFQDQFSIQNIVISQTDSLLYFKSNYGGRMMSHLLPSNQPYPSRLKLYNDIQFIRYSRKGETKIIIKQQKNITDAQKINIFQVNIKIIYPRKNDKFNVDILRLSQNRKWWIIPQKSTITTKQINQQYISLYTYSNRYSCVAYVSQSNIVLSYQRIENGQASQFNENQTLKNKDIKSDLCHIIIHQIEQGQRLIGLNFLQILINQVNHVYLFITFQDKCLVFQIHKKFQPILNTEAKFLKKKFNNFIIQIDNQNIQDQKVYTTNDNRIQQKSQQNFLKMNVKQLFQVWFDDKSNCWKIANNKKIGEMKNQENLYNQKVVNRPQRKINYDERASVNLQIPIDRRLENSQDKQKYSQVLNLNKLIQIKQKQIGLQILTQQSNFLQKIHSAVIKDQFMIGSKEKITIGGSAVICWKQTQSFYKTPAYKRQNLT